MKIAVILGTRPEIIKLSVIIRICQEKKYDYFVIHTGQHYSYEMDKTFFKDLELPEVKYNLDVGSGTHGEQTAKILERIEQVLIKEKPDIALVQGDTNTVLAGGLAASKLGIKVGHVEAGLRSYDRNMPEETNRVLTDHLSDFLFCPTENSKKIAASEKIDEEKIYVTGNTIVDAVIENKKIAAKKSNILEELKIKKEKYILVTAHRQENVDVEEKLQNLISAFEELYNKYKMPIIYPMHPRTQKMIKKFNIRTPENLKIINPVGFLDFLMLEANAKIILTDSGGVQEESCILQIPCVTLRENTERPETIEVGSNKLAGTDPENIIKAVEEMINITKNWENPFGNGKSSEKILEILKQKIK